MVKAYTFMTIVIFILGTSATGFSLYATFNNKLVCTTNDNVQSCATSNPSTHQKIGNTILVVVQWLIDLCEYYLCRLPSRWDLACGDVILRLSKYRC